MTISFFELSGRRFRLTDSTHSGEVSESSPDFKLTEGELSFRAEQIEPDDKVLSAQGFGYWFKHFTRVFWGYFAPMPIYKKCSPILLEADVEVKTERYREHTVAFTPSDYSPDLHDYTAPKLDGGKDLRITPICYKVNQAEVKRRQKETLVERLGLSTFLFLLPIVFMLVSASIQAGTLTMIGIFSMFVLYPLIALILFLWRRSCKQFEVKVKNKVLELNTLLQTPQYK